MISSMLKLQSFRPTPAAQMPQNVNYKDLYLQCKQNVAVFMKQVEKEISTILKNHEAEKKKLQAEIQSLRTQLQNSKNDVSIVMRQNSSYKSNTNKKYNSQLKERNNTSVSKQTVEECLAKFSGFNLKTTVSERKASVEGSLINEKKEKRRSSVQKTYNEEKENNFLTSQLTEHQEIDDILIQPLRLISNLPTRREKRLQEKRANDKPDKAENIKDVLKNIRGKLSSGEKASFFSSKQQDERPTLTVITPEMFNSSRSNHN